MNPIMLAILIVAGVGLVAGLVLAVASVVMAVPRDEKVEAVRDALPGANCGACGYSGCDGYAHALVHEGAKVGLCSPGGAETAEKTSTLLGVSGTVEVKTAMVRCGGCEAHTARKLDYHGIPSLRGGKSVLRRQLEMQLRLLGLRRLPCGVRIRGYYGGRRPRPHRSVALPRVQQMCFGLSEGG